MVNLEDLKVALGRLPKKQSETASLGWSGISQEAQIYLLGLAPVTDQSKPDSPPWKVEQEIKALADCAKTLQHKLETISAMAVKLIETEAYTDRAVGADPFAWFPIQRYSFDPEGVPTPEEPWWAHDYSRPEQLRILADLLDHVAESVASVKSPPTGKRAPSHTRQIIAAAKIRLITELHYGLHLTLNRPKSHVLPIAQVIHTWASEEPVGKEWGKTEFDRLEEEFKSIRT